MEYRTLPVGEIDRALFASFVRRQVVTDCWRRGPEGWQLQRAPFVDDWGEAEYGELVRCLRRTAGAGGLVAGAFCAGALKGFVSVEPGRLGSRRQYLDLSSLHVSADCRGQGVGRALFLLAKRWARERGAEKLYISSHSAAETQAFYRAMGCVEAWEYQLFHLQSEPFDCQLECPL